MQLLAQVVQPHLGALAGAAEAEGSTSAGRSLRERHGRARDAGLAALLQGALDLCHSGAHTGHSLWAQPARFFNKPQSC